MRPRSNHSASADAQPEANGGKRGGSKAQGAEPPTRSHRLQLALAAVALVVVAGIAATFLLPRRSAIQSTADSTAETPARISGPGTKHYNFGRFTLWHDAIPDQIRQRGVETGTSNIFRQDYIGPDSCKDCHPKNHAEWSQHPHRFMNSLVKDIKIHGDFSGNEKLYYLGGEVSFYKEGDELRMKFVRGDVTRVAGITQTVGSRFFQYYVARQLEGPEPRSHRLYNFDHVLPVGYWIDRQEWVPVVHVHGELPDGQRFDPFAQAQPQKELIEAHYSECNYCHTTWPIADAFVRTPQLMGNAPRTFHFGLMDHVQQAYPEVANASVGTPSGSDRFIDMMQRMTNLRAPDHAVTLGISCEACHLGAREHAEAGEKAGSVLPRWFPTGPGVSVDKGKSDFDPHRNRENVNFVCSRCHHGHRQLLAAELATWNSTEYTDAMRGSCYSQLTCITCHNPHKATGPAWTHTADEDDAKCLKCHTKYEKQDARLAHTHHKPGSEGSRCMNCHMPRMNEGLQDVVRTHKIFSPTEPRMIAANQPNACNMCHVEKSVQWSVGKMQEWYHTSFPAEAIKRAGAEPDRPAPLQWLDSQHPAVRLLAADALTRQKARWALPQLAEALDDPFLLNRQFARIGLEKMLGIELIKFGYRFYMTPPERKTPLEQFRKAYSVADDPTGQDARRQKRQFSPSKGSSPRD